MVLGGLWHGAGWNFAIWGALHGFYLVMNYAWIALAERVKFPIQSSIWKWGATAITFTAVCVAWVFFRAPDLATALMIVHGMIGGFGVGLPDTFGNYLGGFKPVLEEAGITFYLGGTWRFVENWVWVICAAVVAFLMPNAQQIVRQFQPALDFDRLVDANSGRIEAALEWVPSRRWAALIGILALGSLLGLNRPSEFLYFQF
jgi:hypothetical protein